MLATIKTLLLAHAETVLVGKNIARINEDFEPDVTAPYYALSWFPAEPDRRFAGKDDPHFYDGIFQVLVSFPKGDGVDAVTDAAQWVADRFPVGVLATDNDAELTLKVTRKPAIGGGYTNGEHYSVPVSVRYRGTPWRHG